MFIDDAIDTVVGWFKSWRSKKAGSELVAGQEAVDATDTAAAEIVSRLSEPPNKPAIPHPSNPMPIKPATVKH